MTNTEKLIDEQVNKFLDKGLVKKIVKNDLMKQILDSSFMESVSKSLDSSWKTIMQVLGILAIIFGVFGFVALLGVGGPGALLGGAFSVTFILSIVLGLAGAILFVIGGWGMFKMKKRLPFIYTLSFFVTVLSTLVSAAGWGGNGSYIGLVISVFFWFIILKKRKTFTK